MTDCNSATGCAAIIETPKGDYVAVGKILGSTTVRAIFGLSIGLTESAVFIPREVIEKFLEQRDG